MKKIAILSTRLGGIDGVSIEASKWAKAYRQLGLDVIYIAGKFFDRSPLDDCFRIEKLDYYDDDIFEIRKSAFPSKETKSPLNARLYQKIDLLKEEIKYDLKKVLKGQEVDHLSIENALSIPLNIPLGIALTETIIELGIKSVTRHHDLYWEREEFLQNNIVDILDMYFPPDIADLTHVVINTIARDSLIEKKSITPLYIPNIFDFDNLKMTKDRRKEVRGFLDVGPDDFLFLQPTRIIRRKNIERTVELVARVSKEIDNKVILFISGRPEEDEIDYFYRILDLARTKKIKLILNEDYKCSSDSFLGKAVFEKFSIFDIYSGCDFVTLPSDIEGFGNPVIEASVFKKPLFVNRYPVLEDMLEKGFEFVLIDKKITDEALLKTIDLLKDKDLRRKITDRNFDIAKEYYSMEYLVEKLSKIFSFS